MCIAKVALDQRHIMPKTLLNAIIALLAVLTNQAAVLANDTLVDFPSGGIPYRVAEAGPTKPDEVLMACDCGSLCP